MRMGNPSMRKILNRAQSGELYGENTATYGGIAKKALIYGGATLAAMVLTSILLKLAFKNADEFLLTIVIVGFLVSAIPMLVISLVIAFVPSTVKVLGIIYSFLQGLFLGVTVYFVDAFFPGIAFAALLGTILVFGVCLVCNKVFEVKIPSTFMRGMLIAFISVLALELILFILSLFVGSFQSFFRTYFVIQLIINVFCVIYATIMLLWDLKSADSIVQAGADKKYEWNVAFSLVTTLIYMYLEILELLLRLAALFGKKK